MGEKRGTTALQLWCRKMVEGYVDVNIYNMTTSWRDGRAFCALVNKCASLRNLPDLIDFENLKKEDIYENNEKAFRIAEEYFNIPSLLDPHDMVKYEVPDKLSVLTYLSQFYQVFGSYDIGLKNRETSSDDNNDSKKSQPTAPQMAHSVPKREPCFSCKNPVFFAERLVINSMLYHRSCFRCARCHSTLTLGNFYETETENEFCCETCPDEEKKYASNDNLSVELSHSDDLGSISDVKDSSSVNEKCDEEFEELYRQTQDDEKPGPSLNTSNVDASSNHSVVHASDISPEKLLKVHLNEETIKDNENEISAGSNSEVTLNQDENVIAPSDSEVKNEEIEENHRSLMVENEPSENSEHSVVQVNELIEQSVVAARDELQLSNNDDECVAAVVDNDQPEDDIKITNESEDNDTQLRHEHEQQDVINSESETRKCDKKPIPTPRCSNPFGDFDDESANEEENIDNSQKIHYKKELNPFGSESEDENVPVKQLTVPTNNKMSRDSFASPPTTPSHKTNDSSKFSSTKKKRAPKPPTPRLNEIFSQAPVEKSPNLSTTRKKRPAPTPPAAVVEKEHKTLPIENSNDDEKRSQHENESSLSSQTISEEVEHDQIQFRRKISLDESLQSSEPATTATSIDTFKETEGSRRRKIFFGSDSMSNNNYENDKNEKDISNLNLRYSMEASTISEDQQSDEPISIQMLNKSSHGKWKRRKDRPAPIPGFAQPQRRILQMLPLQEIRHELEKIEVQQQGLEKQGVILEKMIRERCENETDNKTADSVSQNGEKSEKEPQNSKEVEDLIIQLFELVNEKNDLFRRQAELMYLRREYRLEEEQADVEYEIRKLLSQPENNKTDHDKIREENLIQRLVEIVSQRNEIVDCLDRDRLREFEEDKTIKDRLETHTAQIEKLHNSRPSTSSSLSKKEKKKMKELKKLKNKKFDDDKDLDTTEAKPKKSDKKKKLGFFKRSKD